MPFKQSLRRVGEGETKAGKQDGDVSGRFEPVRPSVLCSSTVRPKSRPADCGEEAARKLEEENAALLEQIRQLELEHTMLDQAGKSKQCCVNCVAFCFLTDQPSVIVADTLLRTDSGAKCNGRVIA